MLWQWGLASYRKGHTPEMCVCVCSKDTQVEVKIYSSHWPNHGDRKGKGKGMGGLNKVVSRKSEFME